MCFAWLTTDLPKHQRCCVPLPLHRGAEWPGCCDEPVAAATTRRARSASWSTASVRTVAVVASAMEFVEY